MASKREKPDEYHVFKCSEGIWKYYLRGDNGQQAKCKICDSVIKTTGGCTKGLHVHHDSKLCSSSYRRQ